MMIKRREPKVKPSIRLILFRHGLHEFHGFSLMEKIVSSRIAKMISVVVYPVNVYSKFSFSEKYLR